MAEFNSGLFGCFSDPKLCIVTFCIPCFTIGKNAEASVDEDCMLIGLLCCVGVNTAAVLRWRLREKENLRGSMIMDVLIHTCCSPCALVQEAKHIGWTMPDKLEDVDKKQGDMYRE